MAQDLLELHDTIWTYYYLLTMESTMNAFTTYPKVSPTSMPVDEVEEWLNTFPHKRAENKPNGGIIQSTPSVIFVDGLGDRLTPSERRIAERKAKQDFKAAKRALALQEKEDEKAIAKKLREWSSSPKQTSKVTNRLNDLKLRLNNGEHIPVPKNQGISKKEYQNIRRDMRVIAQEVDGDIVRVKAMGSIDSFWLIDNIETYAKPFNTQCKKSVRAVLETGKSIRITSDLQQDEVRGLAAVIQQLGRRKGMGITIIYGLNNTVKGWVVL